MAKHSNEIVRVLNDWATPATDYERRVHGCAEITEATYEKGIYQSYRTNGAKFYELTRDVSITNLKINGETWMVDDPPHWWSIREHARHYHGQVLVAGLGLGLIVHALCENENVRTIVVVEREKDVIDLVWNDLPHRAGKPLMCIHDDFWEVANDSRGCDGVFFDLFVGQGRDLITSAIGCRIQLDSIFGPECVKRILGFDNDHLESISKGYRTLCERKS